MPSSNDDLDHAVADLRQEVALLKRFIMPTGAVISFAGRIVPSGWLLCDGAAVGRVEYAVLFKLIGETYGAGDGSNTFNLPDLRGRTVIGSGQGDGLSDRMIGQELGEENHLLTVGEMPSHAHNGSCTSSGGHNHSGSTAAEGRHAHSGSTAGAGGHGHSGMTNTANPKKYRTVLCSGTAAAANHEKGWGSCGDFKDYNNASFSNADHTHDFTTSVINDHAHGFSTDGVGDHVHGFVTEPVENHMHTINPEGGMNVHNNMSPCLVLAYIIKI